MAEYWNTVLTAAAVIDVCDELGVDTAALLRDVGISAETLADPEALVSLEQMRVFWAAAIERSGVPSLGLRAGMRAPHGLYGAVDYMIHYSSTIGDALHRLTESLPLYNNWIRSHIEDHGDRMHLVFDVVWGAMPRPPAEFCAGWAIGRSRAGWANDWSPEVVRFGFPAPSAAEPAREHERTLQCAVEFGADRTELILPRSTWDQPVSTSDPGLVEVLERQRAQLLERLPAASSLVADIRREVRNGMAGGDQTIEAVASRLGVGRRTLQRRLAAEGLTFGSIADEMRFESARIALADLSIPLAHIAYLIGFEEQSSFSRAFRRWTGVSPKEYRQNLTPS